MLHSALGLKSTGAELAVNNLVSFEKAENSKEANAIREAELVVVRFDAAHVVRRRAVQRVHQQAQRVAELHAERSRVSVRVESGRIGVACVGLAN